MHESDYRFNMSTFSPRLRLEEEPWLDREGGGVSEWEWPTGPGEGLKPRPL